MFFKDSSCFSFEIISNLQKSCKNSTKNILSTVWVKVVDMTLHHPQKHFSVLFPAQKCILHNHNTAVKMRIFTLITLAPCSPHISSKFCRSFQFCPLEHRDPDNSQASHWVNRSCVSHLARNGSLVSLWPSCPWRFWRFQAPKFGFFPYPTWAAAPHSGLPPASVPSCTETLHLGRTPQARLPLPSQWRHLTLLGLRHPGTGAPHPGSTPHPTEATAPCARQPLHGHPPHPAPVLTACNADVAAPHSPGGWSHAKADLLRERGITGKRTSFGWCSETRLSICRWVVAEPADELKSFYLSRKHKP